MKEIFGEIDSKGRITIPLEVRKSLGINPKDRVKIKIEEVIPKRSFLKECTHLLKDAGDAVELLHKESPLRWQFR